LVTGHPVYIFVKITGPMMLALVVTSPRPHRANPCGGTDSRKHKGSLNRLLIYIVYHNH
jgi:hypothetical protein